MPRFSVSLCLFCAAASAPAASLSVVNGASYAAALAPSSIAVAFGADLGSTASAAATVAVSDSAGAVRQATVLYAAPQQAAFVIPDGTATGAATVTFTSGDGTVSTAAVQISPVAPGLFSANANGQGVAAAVAVQGANASLIFTCGSAPLSCAAVPVTVNQTTLELYGTGIRGHTISVTCAIGGVSAPVLYAGAQGQYAGLDQVNVALPASLANQGLLNIVVTVDGVASNAVTINTGAPVASAATYYVAPNGNDSWSGTLPTPNANSTDGPFATPGRAQQAARSSGPGPTVILRAGTYYLPQALTLTAADSGVTWKNYPGESPVLSGGRAISGWTPSAAIPGAWQASVQGFQYFEQLWVGGQRRYLVRVPVAAVSGYLYNLGPLYVTSSNGCTNSNYKSGYSQSYPAANGEYECFDRFFFQTGDINPAWSGLSDPNHPIRIASFEDWTIARLPLESIGAASGIAGDPFNSSVAYLTGATIAGQFWGFLTGHRYLIEGVKEALTAATPGEFFVDRDASGNPQTVTYVPASGEDFASAPPTAIAPQLSQLIVANDPGLSGVTFAGLTFSHANWTVGALGYSSSGSSEDTSHDYIPAALSFTRASHITLNGITIAQTGGWGAEFIGTNSQFTPNGTCSSASQQNCNNLVINSVVTDLGAGGIRLGIMPAATDADSSVAQYNLVYNTVIAGGDRMEPGAAISVGDSHHNAIDHNDIYDFYNTAINLGNSLNFGANGLPNWTHDNQITYNHIYHLGQGVTSDMGAVHAATGLSLGNAIEFNNFHDITHDPGQGGYGGWGIYFDQGSTFLTAINNLVYNTSATGFTYNHSESGTYQLLGTPNLVENNIFAFGAQATIHRNLDDGALNFTFRNNVVYWDQTQPVSGPPSPQIGTFSCSLGALTGCFDFAQNMYYSAVDPTMSSWRFTGSGKLFTLAQWQAAPNNEDEGSTATVDPLFVCASAKPCAASGPYDFHLQSGSPAPQAIQFTPFDYTLAGRANPLVTPPALPPAFPLQLGSGVY